MILQSNIVGKETTVPGDITSEFNQIVKEKNNVYIIQTFPDYRKRTTCKLIFEANQW